MDHGMPRAGHAHTGRALCADVVLAVFDECCLQAPLTLPWTMACLGLATHTLAGLCALCLPINTYAFGKLQY